MAQVRRRVPARPVSARPSWHAAYVGVGSNLDAPHDRVAQACTALGQVADTRLLFVSRLYRSPPVGFLDQPPFVNAVAVLLTRLSPQALHAALAALERAQGKITPEVRYGPRRIDLDLLAYDEMTLATPALVVPHPRLHERAFVLYPLSELAPALWIPGRGRVSALREAVDGTGVEPLTG